MEWMRGLVPILFLIAAWVAFGWVYDYSKGFTPWFGKNKKRKRRE